MPIVSVAASTSSPPSKQRSWTQTGFGLALGAVLAAMATAVGARLATVSSLVIAMLIGIALRGLFDLSASVPTTTIGRRILRVDQLTRPGLRLASKTVLRFGVVLLGLRLSLSGLAELGVAAIALIVVAVVGTFFATRGLGHKLGLSPDLSLLIAAGSSICGASAIAAAKETTEASEEEVAVAISLVTACGTLGLFALPALGSLIGLDPDQLGFWLGASIQDVAQVVAAGSLQGGSVLAVAVLVKLTRVALLAPMVTGLSLQQQRKKPKSATNSPTRTSPIPLFIVAFLAMMALRTSGLLGEDLLNQAKTVEKAALSVAMVGIGSNVSLSAIRRLGFKPAALGLAAWLIISTISLVGILVL